VNAIQAWTEEIIFPDQDQGSKNHDPLLTQ